LLVMGKLAECEKKLYERDVLRDKITTLQSHREHSTITAKVKELAKLCGQIIKIYRTLTPKEKKLVKERVLAALNDFNDLKTKYIDS